MIETTVLPSCGTAAFVGETSKTLDVALTPSLLSWFITKVDAGGMLDASDINAAFYTGKSDQVAIDIMSVPHQVLNAGEDAKKDPKPHAKCNGKQKLPATLQLQHTLQAHTASCNTCSSV